MPRIWFPHQGRHIRNRHRQLEGGGRRCAPRCLLRKNGKISRVSLPTNHSSHVTPIRRGKTVQGALVSVDVIKPQCVVLAGFPMPTKLPSLGGLLGGLLVIKLIQVYRRNELVWFDWCRLSRVPSAHPEEQGGCGQTGQAHSQRTNRSACHLSFLLSLLDEESSNS